MSDETEQRQRLIWAREKAGYRTAKAAADAFGWGGSTYSAHENGQNKLKIATARQYATAFRVSLCWLLAGEGTPNGEPHELTSLWERLTEPQRLRVIAFAEGILADQPPPPAPQSPPVVPSNMVRPRPKEQPEIPTIHSGNRRPRPVHLAAWLEHAGWTPEDLAKRIDMPDAAPDAIPGLISGKYIYDQDWLYQIAKALRTSIDSLYGPPPKAETAKKEGKKAAKR